MIFFCCFILLNVFSFFSMIDLFTSSSTIKKKVIPVQYTSLWLLKTVLSIESTSDDLLVYPFCSQYDKYFVRFSLLALKNNMIKSLTFWNFEIYYFLIFDQTFIKLDEHDISFSSILGFLQMFCYVHVAKGSWVLASPWGLISLLELNLLHDFCFFSRTLKCLRISECRLGIEHVFLLSCARSIKLV